MLITLFLCLEWWVVFYQFHVLFLLIFLYLCKSINNVGGHHKWLIVFMAASYELTSVLFLCFSCLMPLLFVANELLPTVAVVGSDGWVTNWSRLDTGSSGFPLTTWPTTYSPADSASRPTSPPFIWKADASAAEVVEGTAQFHGSSTAEFIVVDAASALDCRWSSVPPVASIFRDADTATERRWLSHLCAPVPRTLWLALPRSKLFTCNSKPSHNENLYSPEYTVA